MMDLDLLSPKRKRSGRALALKKSNSSLPRMTNSSDKVESFSSHESDNETVAGSCATFLASEPILDEPRCQDNSPLKSRRYSDPITESNDDNSKESTSSSATNFRYVKDANGDEGDGEKDLLSSPSSPFTPSQINTTFDSSSLILRCDDTTMLSSLSPGSPQSSSFMKEAATERKSSARIEESDWPVHKSTSERSNQRREAKEFQHGNCGVLRNIISSDYSPEVMIRKGSYGCDIRASSSSAGAHGTAFKRSNFTCPGSENLRHDQRTEDEWRSSFEGDDGESDEEEKSGNSSSCMTDRIKLKFSDHQLFENDNSIKSTNSRLSDEDEHQQMDSNMSSMALHVAKACIHGKGRIRSRTIFDTEPPSGEGIELRFLARRNRVGGSLLRNNPLISDDSTSFVDALAVSGSSGGERDGAQYSSRTSFTATFRNPFDQMQNEDFGNNEGASPHDVSQCSDRGEWDASPAKFTRKTGGGYHLFSSLSSPSPDDNQQTPPRSIIATAAASMGDLGTPVTEVGSPADIDMGTAYDPYAAGEDCEDLGGHDGMFGYCSNRHSTKHEEAFLKGRDHNSRSPDPALYKYQSNLLKPAERSPSLVADPYGGRRREDKSSSFTDHADMYISNSTAFLQRHDDRKCSRYTCSSSSSEKELNHLDGIYLQNRGVFSSSSSGNSTIFNGVTNIASHAVSSTSRPQPVQSAFNSSGPGNIAKNVCGGVGGEFPSTPMRALPACPATPMRTPTWAATERATSYNNSDEERDRMLCERERPDGTEHHSLISRQNSLTTNKVLLSLSDTLDSSDVSYHRDFEQEGFLGSGNFADVYQAKERNGKSYAVKKFKKPFRSKKERHLLMGEVLIMEKLAAEQCEYIVPLVRAWQEEGFFFVQIGLAERGTLKDLLTDLAIKNSEPLDSTVWHILHDVTSGLQHIHKFGVVHLDVKPANLLISMNGIIQIGDFGTAAHLGKGEDGHEGDGRYLAFEVLNSRDRYPSADIFSLGLTIYETCISCTPQYRDHVALGNSPLPSDGPQWHVLRDGDPPDPPGRDVALCALIRATLHPVAFERPSTQDILSLPDVCSAVLHRRSDVLCSATAPKPDTQQLSRPQSFMGSMGIIDTSINSSTQLLEAGCYSAALPSIYEGDRAITPTGANGGSTFWPSPPVKKWDEKEKDGDAVITPSITSKTEHTSALASISTPVISKFAGSVSSPVCPIKEESESKDSPFAASSSSSCMYDCSHWSSPSDSPPRIQSAPASKLSRPGDAYFPLPKSNWRIDRFPVCVEVPTDLMDPCVSTPLCTKGGMVIKDFNRAFYTEPTSSSTAKFSYSDSGRGFDQLACGKDSIGEDNVFSSVGPAGYRPSLPFSTPGGFQARNSSNSLIRAGMETVSSKGRSSGKERLDN